MATTQNPRTAVLVDRSRDLEVARELIGLEPDTRYHTTDNRVPLSARTLARYDVLVIGGHGLATYSARELDAIVGFVRRGGALLLAASTGVFQRYTGRAPDEMAVAAVARRFGIEFLSPRDAKGKPKADPDLVVGYPPKSVKLHRCAPLRDVLPSDVHLEHWSPLRAPKGARALTSHRRTGEAAAVDVPVGKGRVVAVADTMFLVERGRLLRRLLDRLAGAGGGHRVAGRLPYEILPPLKTARAGKVELRTSPAVADRLPVVRRLARQIVPGIEAMVNAEKPGDWCIELAPSCTSFVQRWWRGPAPVICLGVDASDAELAFALGCRVMEPLMWRCPVSRMLYDASLGYQALLRSAGVAAMRWAGFEAEAERLAEAFERDSRRRFDGIDPAFYYPYGDDSPGFWLWRELERQHGDGLVKRFFKAVPKKVDWEAAPSAVFTPLDRTIHFLSKATRADLVPWFAERGAAVHRLPRARWGSKPFKQGVRRAIARQLADAAQPASERADALYALIECQHRDKKCLAHAARQARAEDPATRLLGAALLARVRDPRGADALRALAAGKGDPALAALAALMLADEGDGAAADRLAALAEGLDHRFQLLVGHLLERLGHPRAGRFTLDGIRKADGPKAARIDVKYDGELMVFPTVDGVHAANIFSAEDVGHLPGNTHVSRFFVHWVHTAGKFRRRGLARRAMQRTFDDPRARRCSCATLGTGTRNTAHALYRSFGFVDIRPGESLECGLERQLPRIRARGIRVRAFRPGDGAAMARLFGTCYGEFRNAGRKRPTCQADGSTVLLAHAGRKLVAYAKAFVHDKDASIHEIAVAPGKKREELVGPLMWRLHQALAKKGAKKVRVWMATEMLAPLLQPLGYVSRKHGGVGMFTLIHLPQFLEEIAPLLERRLKKKDWTGTLALCGETHRGGLTFRNGRVTVHERPPARADITLEGSDAALTRIVAGIHSPFEPYLQLDLKIAPALNHRFLELLEALFPKVQDCW